MNSNAHTVTAEQTQDLLHTLQARFHSNMQRHENISWPRVEQALVRNPEKLWSLYEMERTGGEPDVVVLGSDSNAYVFCDCSPESPIHRRSLCYDDTALAKRVKNKPSGSAMGLAHSMGIELLTESEYRHLQTLGIFDTKTSSWVATPATIRDMGGALFCDRRYNHVFLYHNGAESYYESRGFRGLLKL